MQNYDGIFSAMALPTSALGVFMFKTNEEEKYEWILLNRLKKIGTAGVGKIRFGCAARAVFSEKHYRNAL